MNFDRLSRRDFLKKTTILAVGTSSFTLFSGLANAEEQDYVTCYYPHGPEVIDTYFMPLLPNGGLCWNSVKCNNGQGPYVQRWICPDPNVDPEAFEACSNLASLAIPLGAIECHFEA